MVGQGGSYIVAKKGAKPKRVEWTRTPAEAEAEKRKPVRKTAPAKPAAGAPPKAVSTAPENGSDGA